MLSNDRSRRLLTTNRKDGAGWGSPYLVPKYPGPEPAVDIKNAKMYYGSCHCGAVTLALKSLPLDKDYPEQVVDCSCSICSIAGMSSHSLLPTC